MIRLRVMEPTLILTGLDMRESGETINNTAREERFGKMELFTLVILRMAKNSEKGK